MDVHQESMAVAYVAQAHDAEVTFLGAIGTRPVDIDQRVRKLHSTAPHLVVVDEAGPWG
jgi:transposase